jgi:hypothetical protein
MSSEPALAVLATRIRMALLRQTHQSVDANNMVADTGYAQEVIALCRASHQSNLGELADQFEQLLRTAGRALPGVRPPGPPTSRFDTNRAVVEAQANRTAPPAAPANTPATSAPAAKAAEPEPPKPPTDRRYIRGAR